VGEGALPKGRDIAAKDGAVKLFVCELAAASLPCARHNAATEVAKQKLP
jgi:hypothetical protein